MFESLLFKRRNGDAGVSFAELAKTVRFHILVALQQTLDSFSESPGSLAVHDADGWKMGQIGIVQVFVKLCDCFIHCLA